MVDEVAFFDARLSDCPPSDRVRCADPLRVWSRVKETNHGRDLAQQAFLENGAEAEIIETLERLLSLAQEARLTDTIAYLAVCRSLIYERRKRRLAERH